MRLNVRQGWTIAAFAAAALSIAACVFGEWLAGEGLRAAAWSAGYRLAFDALDVRANRLVASNTTVANAGDEPIARIGHLEVRFSLRDMLPGGTHAYGVTGFDVEHARISLIRHKNGSWNVPIPQRGGAAAQLGRVAFYGRLRDVAIDIEDRAQGVPAARHLSVQAINADAAIDTQARSQYRAQFAYVESGQRFPVYGRGDVDVPAGVALQRWRAAQLPIARIVDVALNSPSFHIVGGALHAVDARIVGLPDARGNLVQHLSATATIQGARIAIGGLVKPLRDVNGPLAVYGDGLLLRDVAATIAGVPIRLGGGVSDLSHPAFHLTVAGRGDLRRFRTVLAQTGVLPLAGPATLDVTVEGAASKPLTLIALQSDAIRYATVTIGAPSALVAFDGQELDVVNAGARYAGASVFARGRLNLHPKRQGLEMLAGLDAAPGTLPYSRAVVPELALHADVLATGDRPSDALVRGIVYGSDGRESLNGMVSLRSNGVGTVGPVRLSGGNRVLYALGTVDRPHGTIDAALETRNLRAAGGPSVAATVDASLRGGLRDGRLAVSGVANLRDIRTPAIHTDRASLRFGSTSHAPLLVSIEARGIGALDALAAATVAYDRGTARIEDAVAAARGTFAAARGTIAGITSGAPAYDLDAVVHSADLASLMDFATPAARTYPIEGTLDAHLHVVGNGSHPDVRGVVAMPEGAINGLAFHALNVRIAGSPAAVALRNGRVAVGSSEIAFDGGAAAGAQRLSVAAPRVDLRDFNDFFDPGDMLAGHGSAAARVALAGGGIAATSGDVGLQNATYRQFAIGTATAHWSGSGEHIDMLLATSGKAGRLQAAGVVGIDGAVAMTLHARGVDLAQALPMAGIVFPVTGTAVADLRVSGRYPALEGDVNAGVAHGSAGRVPIEAFAILASLHAGRGHLTHASLRVPHAFVDGNGTFGLNANDPLALRFHGSSDDVAALSQAITGHKLDAAGKLDTTLRVGGSRAHPALTDDFTLLAARYGRFTVPRASGRVRVDERTAALSGGELDLRRGRVLADAIVPIRLVPLRLDPQDRLISGALVSDDVEASNFADLLPKGTTVAGRIDGRVGVSGTIAAPRAVGSLNLTQGRFAGPQEREPITDVTARMAFDGATILLQNASARAGGGGLSADGRAILAGLRDPASAAVAFNARANALRLDLPQYIKGRFDGALTLTRAAHARPILGGDVAISNARIPMTALYNPKPAGGSAPALPDVGFDLNVSATRDVRVISSNVDIGGKGAVHIGGSLQAPQLAGNFSSTGGTVSFVRTFRLQDATVAFDPTDGVVPTVDARATTTVSDPRTYVVLRVTGPATNLNVAFSSDPPYDREQILGMLVNAQSVGAVRGVASSKSASFSASSAVTGLAANQLNTVFTRNLLEPLSLAVGETLGLQDFAITNDVQGGLGLNAAKSLGENISFVFAESFNEPRRTSWSLLYTPVVATTLQLTTYSTQATGIFALSDPPAQYTSGSNFVTTLPTMVGTNGVNLLYKLSFP